MLFAANIRGHIFDIFSSVFTPLNHASSALQLAVIFPRNDIFNFQPPIFPTRTMMFGGGCGCRHDGVPWCRDADTGVNAGRAMQ